MLSCCNHGTLSGEIGEEVFVLHNNFQAGEMEEAMAVLEEAEPLLKEEELAERGREGEKWASSVYLAKGRVLEALDSRPQVFLNPSLPILVCFECSILYLDKLIHRQQRHFKLHLNKMSFVWRLLRR